MSNGGRPAGSARSRALSRRPLPGWVVRTARRHALATLRLVTVAAVLGACGGGGDATDSRSPAAPRAGTGAKAQMVVEPAQGPIGTVFTFRASSLPAGSAVVFRITGPNNHDFTGSPRPVAADGTVTGTYRATPTNFLGVYTVHATDNGRADLVTVDFTIGEDADLAPSRPSRTTATGGTSRTFGSPALAGSAPSS